MCPDHNPNQTHSQPSAAVGSLPFTTPGCPGPAPPDPAYKRQNSILEPNPI